MNAPARISSPQADGSAAHRRRFSTADVERMTETGVLGPDERLELIEGELYRMSPKRRRHEHYKRRLLRWFAARLGETLALGVEQTLYLADDQFAEPDIVITCDDLASDEARGPDVLLLIEISDTSLAFNLSTKARLYASHGIRDYWVIDTQTGRLIIHRTPDADQYREVLDAASNAEVTPLLLPTLALRLGDIIA